MKGVKLAAVLMTAHTMLTPAFAQQSAESGSVGSGTAAPASTDEAPDNGDIVVTALKQSLSLQKTPAAISVVSGEDITKRNVADIRSLGPLVPSFKTNVEGSATQIFARGVGKQVDQGNIPDAVGVVIDGLSIPQHASAFGMFDVSSVQILPGPQGTLYGSSAIGGVVNITTNRPTNDFSGSALVEVGNYNSIHAMLVQNAPITANWSLRAAYNGIYHSGYNSDGTYNGNTSSFRLSSLYETDSGLTFFLSGMYAFDRYRQSPSIPYPYQGRSPFDIIPFDPDTAVFYPPNGGPTGVGRVRSDVVSITAEISKKIGDVTVTYTGGYLNRTTPSGGKDGYNIYTVAGFVSPLQYDIDLFNNELRFTGDSGRLKWIAGLYQFYSKGTEFYVFGPNLAGYNYDTIRHTYAAYGQATYSITDSTRVTAGLRVSNDGLKTNDDAKVFFPTGSFPNFDRGVIQFKYDENWSRLNWKLAVEQDLSSRSMFYAFVQSGFNPGTFNSNPPDPAGKVKPQSMIGYTAGIKNRFGPLTLNVEGFLYNYKDQIIAVSDLVNGTTLLGNAQKTKLYGFQVDGTLEVASNTQLRGNVGYLHARFDEFNYTSGGTRLDFAGNTPSYAPKFTANLGATQKFDLPGGGILEARADSYLTTSYWFEFANTPGFNQGGYSKTDASLTYISSDEKWQIGLWIKNIENEWTVAAGGTAPGRSYPGAVYVEPPRTWGGRLSVNW